MANVENFNVGAQQLLDFDLLWIYPYERACVKPGSCALVVHNPYDGVRVDIVDDWSSVLWNLVRFLSVDIEHRCFVDTYEIWHIEDDGELWQPWEYEVQRSRMERELPVPAEVVTARGYAEVGTAWVWGDYAFGEGEEATILVDLESEPYEYYADTMLYGFVRLLFGTDGDGWTFFVDHSYEAAIA